MTARQIFYLASFAACCCGGCGQSGAAPNAKTSEPTASKSTPSKPGAGKSVARTAKPKRRAQTEFEQRLNAVGYEDRVKVWSQRFGKPESWVRQHTNPEDSASDAEAKMVRARVTKKRKSP
jgi:hypothetical protein